MFRGFHCARIRLRVQLQHEHARPSMHRNPLASSRVLEVRLGRTEHDHVPYIHHRTHGYQLSLYIGIRAFHISSPAFSNELQSGISFDAMVLSSARRRHDACLLDAPNTFGSDRIDGDLHYFLHYVNCIHFPPPPRARSRVPRRGICCAGAGSSSGPGREPRTN